VVGGLVRGEPSRHETRRMVEALRDLMAEPGELNRSWPVEAPAEAVDVPVEPA
jgi:hypothetical protein